VKNILPAVMVLMAALHAHDAEPPVVEPFEQNARPAPSNPIDARVLAVLKKRGIEPANLCSDAVFFRRVHLDVIGTLPEPAAVRGFLRDRHADKRAKVIDRLLGRREFADYWSLKWCDLLRVKSEFPINLWPNAVQAYHRWIHTCLRENRPYDQFVREMLTSSGSNFRVPAVNFYRAVQGQKPDAIADAVALTFMGVRSVKWPEARRAGMAAFFSRMAFKGTAEWKEQIVHPDPAATGPLDAVFPDGKRVRIPPGKDPRQVFADWLLAPENKWFARNIVNRIWAWLVGRGIIHEPDDIRPDNPAVNPKLLAYLEKELVRSHYDLRHIYRLILNSGTYQQSPIPRSRHAQAEALFAHYRVRRLDAEVLIDALNRLGAGGEEYWSPIPEPFTFIPRQHPTIELADGSISSPFLEMFGRPARDTGLESERNNTPTAAQRLHLLNSTHVQQKIDRGRLFQRLIRRSRGDPNLVIRSLYLAILSRPPTQDEFAAGQKYLKASKQGLQRSAVDLAWALVNTKEFLYRH